MLGLVLLYFIGKSFYDLALEFNKNKWLFAILGALSYYAGTFVGGILIGVFCVYMNRPVEDINALLISLFAIPFGLLSCWGFHRLLKKQWKNAYREHPDVIDGAGGDDSTF